MSTRRLTVKEIVEDTLEFYNLGNRGFDEAIFACRYLTDDGRRCALGRWILDEWIDEMGAVCGLNAHGLAEEEGTLDNILKPEVRGQSVDFWGELQELHDRRYNWDEDGPTDSGWAHAQDIMARFS